MMFSSSKHKIGNEAGAVAIIVALGLTAFVGFLAIVVDVGYMYEMRRQLQSSADAAALAGMMNIIQGGDGIAAAEDYANRNNNIAPSDPLDEIRSEPFDDDSDGEADEFQVTVRKTANLFFAQIFGRSSQVISAQAKARRVYFVGGKGLIPLTIPIIKATDVDADVEGIDWPLTDDNADGEWDGSFGGMGALGGGAATALAAGGGGPGGGGPGGGGPGGGGPGGPQTYLVDIDITNSQNYVQTFFSGSNDAVAAITVHEVGDPISDVRLSSNTIGAGETTTLHIYSSGPPNITINNDVSVGPVSGSAGHYQATLTAPTSISDGLTPYPIDISVGGYSNENAAILLVRRPNSPIESIEVANNHWLPGDPSPRLTVTVADFDFYKDYIIKYTNGDQAEAGNFSALSFGQILHPPDYTVDHGDGSPGGSSYREHLVNYPKPIHIGDKLLTEPGNMQGPTNQGLYDGRFLNCRCGCGQSPCTMSSDDWVASDRPGNCRKLVTVPITELIEDLSGRKELVVVEIAEFFINDYDPAEGNLHGVFVEYFKGGTSSTEPPASGPYIETIRLVRPDF